jgi:hypothetical protein
MNDSYRLIESMIRQAMQEQAQVIPEDTKLDIEKYVADFRESFKAVSTFELTDRVGADINNREYESLLVSSIQGNTFEEKIKYLSSILSSVGGSYTIQEYLSAMTFAKIAHKLIYDTNYRRSGYAFETLMAVLIGGTTTSKYGLEKGSEDFDIVDLTKDTDIGQSRYSLKFVNEGAIELKANIINMYDEIKRNGFLEYVFCVKQNIESPNQVSGKDGLSLVFKKVVFDETKFFRIYGKLIDDLGIKEQLLNGQPIAYTPDMRRRFKYHIESKKTALFKPSSYLTKNDKNESLITVVLNGINLLRPQTIATLNISKQNISTMFNTSKNNLLKDYYRIFIYLSNLTNFTNKFVYGNGDSQPVLDSADKLKKQVEKVVELESSATEV